MPKSARADERIAAVIFNPTKVVEAELRTAVVAAEAKAGWGPSLWFETSLEDPGAGHAAVALEHGVDVMMAAGGDGTVRAIAKVLRGTGVPIALLPSGTGNLLARNLSLPLDDLPGSALIALTGADRRIDVGIVDTVRPDESVEQHIFLVMAGVGLDARMIANTNPGLKARLGWIAYVEAWARSLRSTARLHLSYQLDEEPPSTMSAHTVLIGNCGTLPANIVVLPDAIIDDGLLDIVALRPEGAIGWFQVWVKVVWENGVLRRSQVGRSLMGFSRETRTVRYLKGRRFVLKLEAPEEFELDGDPFGETISITATVDPLALTVRVPRERD